MKTIEVKLPNNSYELLIERGLINNIGHEVKKVYKGDKVAIVTDENVDRFYGNIVEQSLKSQGFHTLKIVLKPGEKTKSMDQVLELYDSLLNFGINRGNLIIALGGGVIGDLTGFCASTFLRGIPYIQIPTSLLAQIDSSIGGKVAIDLQRGKNLVGSFYHPKAVYIDPEVLGTLERRYLNDGLGEVIKYALIKDRVLFDELKGIQKYEELLENIEDIIYKCCCIKKHVVEADERDTGERMILNFGHTVGHGIEKLQNYEGLSHGEAVSVGMYYITLKSEYKGLTRKETAQEIKSLLKKFDLPYEVQGIKKEELVEALAMDKKNIGKNMNLILLKDIGEAFIHRVSGKDIEKFI
ncbi:MAG: 3-dehydroquinate synthase [Clostridium sp.]